MSEGLGGRAARGSAVTLAAQAIRMVIQFTGVIILSRMLDAFDYGLVAMALSIVVFAELFRDFGLSSAAIQSPTLSRAQRDNLFWLNAAIGVALAFLVYVAASLVARVYGQPEVQGITQALAVTFLINGLTTQYRASLVRALRFKAIAAAEVSSAAIGLGVAILCASVGLGYWSLVIQQVVAATILLLGMVILGRWIPRLYTRGVPMRHFLMFGANLLGSQVVGYIANNVDTWTIGIRFGANTLGFYNRAYQLLMTPMSQIRSPSTTVALPVLRQLVDDQPRFNRYVQQGQLALALPVAIAMALAAGSASAVIPVVLTEEWNPAVPYFRLFAIAVLFQTLAFVGYWVYLARGLTNVLFRYSLVSAALRIACILGGSYWGPVGLAVGFAVAPMLAWPISLWWLGRHTEIPQRALYGNALRIIVQALIIGGVSYAVTHFTDSMGPGLSLTLGVLAGTIAYAVLVALVPTFRKDLKQVRTMVALIRQRPSGSSSGD